MTPIYISMYICSPFHQLSHQQSSSSSTATRGYLRKVPGAACLPLERLNGRRELFSNSVVDQCNRIPDWEKMEGSIKRKPGQWANLHSCNGGGEEGSGHNREGWREMDFKQRPHYITCSSMSGPLY